MDVQPWYKRDVTTVTFQELRSRCNFLSSISLAATKADITRADFVAVPVRTVSHRLGVEMRFNASSIALQAEPPKAASAAVTALM